MAAKNLHEEQALLKQEALLKQQLQSVDRLLAALGPAQQQVEYARQHLSEVKDLFEETPANAAFLERFGQALQQNTAEISTAHHLADYLGNEGITNDNDRNALIPDVKAAERSDKFATFVDEIKSLHKQLTEKLTWVSSASEGSVSDVVDERDIDGAKASALPSSDWEGVDGAKQGRRTPKFAKSLTKPMAQLDQWAVALDGNKSWQVFKRYGQQWRHQGKLYLPSRGDCESKILTEFFEKGGSLTRSQLIKLVHKHFSDLEGVLIFKNRVKPTLARLRNHLRATLKLPSSVDPIPWQKEITGYRLMIEVGFVEEDDSGHLQFQQRHISSA